MEIPKLVGSGYESVVATSPSVQKSTPVVQIKTKDSSTSVSFDEGANVFVFKWADANSKQVIQQVPLEAMIELAKAQNKTLGTVVDTKA